MIVPVWLSSQNDPVSEKLVYALLDTQSDTVFIEYAVSQSLKVDSCPVTLKLTTMVGKDSLISSERVSGLRVRGFNSTVVPDRPPAYTKECIQGQGSFIRCAKNNKMCKKKKKNSVLGLNK